MEDTEEWAIWEVDGMNLAGPYSKYVSGFAGQHVIKRQLRRNEAFTLISLIGEPLDLFGVIYVSTQGD